MDVQLKAADLSLKERELGLKEAETGHRMQLEATSPDRVQAEGEALGVQAIADAAQILAQTAAMLVQLTEVQARTQAAPRVMQVVGPDGKVYTGQSVPVGE
jgi:hypothetical protein